MTGQVARDILRVQWRKSLERSSQIRAAIDSIRRPEEDFTFEDAKEVSTHLPEGMTVDFLLAVELWGQEGEQDVVSDDRIQEGR